MDSNPLNDTACCCLRLYCLSGRSDSLFVAGTLECIRIPLSLFLVLPDSVPQTPSPFRDREAFPPAGYSGNESFPVSEHAFPCSRSGQLYYLCCPSDSEGHAQDTPGVVLHSYKRFSRDRELGSPGNLHF